MTYNRFQVALDIQDAGNMRAIVREFVRVVDDAMEELKSTTAVWDDAAVVLMVNKLESLSRSEDRFSAAYALAQERARKVPDGHPSPEERHRSPFGTALIGSRAPPVTFSVDALDTIIRRRQ